MRTIQTLNTLEFSKKSQAFSLIVWIVILNRRKGRTNQSKTVCFSFFQLFFELHQVHVVVPVFVYDFGFMPMLFRKDERGRSCNFFLARAKPNGTHEWNEHMWAVYLGIEVAHIRNVVGGFNIINGHDVHIC